MKSSWLKSLVAAALSIAIGAACAADAEQQALQTGHTFRDCSDCPEMVAIPAGAFLMGSSAEETARDVEAVLPSDEVKYARQRMMREHPQHRVTIDRPFALSKYRVTRGEFAVFVRETGYSINRDCAFFIDHTYPLQPNAGWEKPGFSQTDRDPVVCVNWHDAEAYVAWLNGKLHDGKSAGSDGPYRLPTEAEWEYAARAGTKTARWWGDPIGSGNADCEGCRSQWDKLQPAPSGSFQVNPFGLSDVLGNTWEWTEDCWNETYAGASESSKARTLGDCDRRVMRGGDWTNHPWVLRSASRTGGTASYRTNYIGFRVGKTLP